MTANATRNPKRPFTTMPISNRVQTTDPESRPQPSRTVYTPQKHNITAATD